MVLLASLPLIVLLTLLVVFRWSSQRAGLAAWMAALAVGAVAFGLNRDVLWVSQARGFLLALYVLSILVPALYLYHLISGAGGIATLTRILATRLGDRMLLSLALAWCLSGALEGLAGFGIPIAVIAPILVTLGIEPVLAVACVAVGHAWSVTFGDMGVIFQTLLAIVQMDSSQLAGVTALLLGIACLGCGLGTAFLLGQVRHWPLVVVTSGAMAGVQLILATNGLAQLAAFGAGLAGIGIFFLNGLRAEGRASEWFLAGQEAADRTHPAEEKPGLGPLSVSLGYGGLTVLMLLVTLPSPLHDLLYPFLWQAVFPQVQTASGVVSPSSLGPSFRVFLHPGTVILTVSLVCAWVFSAARGGIPDLWRHALGPVWRTGLPAALGILATIEVAALMEYTGMTLLLAREISRISGRVFPVFSPLIGMIGAFASGSNNNSNVLFAVLQQDAARLLELPPALLVAAQTTGGSLGSMIAPAKIVVGCTTVGIVGRDGAVLKKTVPIGLAVGILIGVLTLCFAR